MEGVGGCCVMKGAMCVGVVGLVMLERKGTWPYSRPQMLPQSPPHSLPPFEHSMEAVFWGKLAGNQ